MCVSICIWHLETQIIYSLVWAFTINAIKQNNKSLPLAYICTSWSKINWKYTEQVMWIHEATDLASADIVSSEISLRHVKFIHLTVDISYHLRYSTTANYTHTLVASWLTEVILWNSGIAGCPLSNQKSHSMDFIHWRLRQVLKHYRSLDISSPPPIPNDQKLEYSHFQHPNLRSSDLSKFWQWQTS